METCLKLSFIQICGIYFSWIEVHRYKRRENCPNGLLLVFGIEGLTAGELKH